MRSHGSRRLPQLVLGCPVPSGLPREILAWPSFGALYARTRPTGALHEDDLFGPRQDHAVSRGVHRDDIVADADRQDILAALPFAADPHRSDDNPRLPPLQSVDDVDAGELLQDGVVLLVPQAVQQRAELGPLGQLARRDVGRADGAEDLANSATDELLVASGGEVGLLVSSKRPGQAEAE